jgi:hypothetical protein
MKGSTTQAPVSAHAVDTANEVRPIARNTRSSCWGDMAQLRRSTQDLDNVSMLSPEQPKRDD